MIRGNHGASGRLSTADYQREFRALGIDIDAIPIDEAADRIRARPIRDQLIAALDGWTEIRFVLVKEKSETAGKEPGDWRMRPLRVARGADTDEFRNRVRLAVSREDQTALRELAQSPDAIRLPAATLQLLADCLNPSTSGEMVQRMELLKRAQQARPDDFFINYELAIGRPDPSEFRMRFVDGKVVRRTVPDNDLLLGDEAIIYATAAVALRPKDGYAGSSRHDVVERTSIG